MIIGGRESASALIRTWENGNGLSVQVLQEFYVNVTRKIAKPLTLTLPSGDCRSGTVDTLAQGRRLEAIGAQGVRCRFGI